MTEQDRNKYEDACINRYAGIFENDSFYEKERVKSCFMSGCEFANSLLEERIKEEHNKAIDDSIKTLNSIAVKDGVIKFLIEELKKLRK